MQATPGILTTVLLAMLLGGCNGDKQVTASQVLQGPAIASSAAPAGPTQIGLHMPSGSGPTRGRLQLAGTPSATVSVGYPYSFQPAVAGASGSHLAFSIGNKPAWASFNRSTGMLSGTPVATDVGEYGPIEISASNGSTTAALPAFSVAVTESATGSVTLSWTAPVTNTDGSAITGLAGYQIAYGTSSSSLSQTINVAGIGLTTYVVDNLTPGTWYFTIRAYNSNGVLSPQTGVVPASIAVRTDSSVHLGGSSSRVAAGM